MMEFGGIGNRKHGRRIRGHKHSVIKIYSSIHNNIVSLRHWSERIEIGEQCGTVVFSRYAHLQQPLLAAAAAAAAAAASDVMQDG